MTLVVYVELSHSLAEAEDDASAEHSCKSSGHVVCQVFQVL
jgi:hypothetical protein